MTESTQEVLYCLLCLLIPGLIILGGISFKKWSTRNRIRKLTKIADYLNWEFQPTYQLPLRTMYFLDENFLIFNKVHYGWQQNALIGKITGINAWIFDCPINRDFDVKKISGRVQPVVSSSYRQTVLLLHLENFEIPHFFLRPSNWSDRFFDNCIEGRGFVIEGTDGDMIQVVFSNDAKKYYAGRKGLNIEAKGSFILIYYNSLDQYLAAEKEEYLDLIAEAEYLIEILDLGQSLAEKGIDIE